MKVGYSVGRRIKVHRVLFVGRIQRKPTIKQVVVTPLSNNNFNEPTEETAPL